MQNQQILNTIKTFKKGTYVPLTKIKDYGNGLVKKTDMIIRLGVSYQNMEINKDRVVEPLPWGSWVPGLENYVIEHKGNYYLRVSNTNSHISKSKYLLNNIEITKEVAETYIDPKKLKSKESAVYNIKFENIISIG
jgi:hypothetical protein